MEIQHYNITHAIQHMCICTQGCYYKRGIILGPLGCGTAMRAEFILLVFKRNKIIELMYIVYHSIIIIL